MNSTEQMQDNLDSLTDFKAMSDVEFKICQNVADIINEKKIIPCTGCDYCSDCPKGVKISSIFDTYNKYQNGTITLEESKNEYANICVNHTECVACGKCADHCPQSINIPELLATKIKDTFE